jgi:LAO/AO transport system kinase
VGFPRAACVSALTGTGLAEAWSSIEALAASRQTSGAWEARRRDQAAAWFESAVEAGLIAWLNADPVAAAHRQALAAEVAAGRVGPDRAAEEFLDRLSSRHRPTKA